MTRYPQSPNSSPASCRNEQWKTPIFFQGEPQRFEIAVYVATTAAASKEIVEYLVEGAVGETNLLKNSISSLDDTIAYWQTRLDTERTRLTAQFTAMEGTIATLNMASNYLNALFYAGNNTGYKTTSKG